MNSLSTSHKTISDGSFFRATREAGNDKLMTQTDAGPGEYEVEKGLNYVKPRAGSIPFTTAKRYPKDLNAGFPGPSVVKHIDKHTPRIGASERSRRRRQQRTRPHSLTPNACGAPLLHKRRLPHGAWAHYGARGPGDRCSTHSRLAEIAKAQAQVPVLDCAAVVVV
jgi:hypothetical protein